MKKLDLKTLLYLWITHANIVKHIKVKDIDKKRNFQISTLNKNDVYVFFNYEEYKNFFLMYLDKIDDEVIKVAIYAKGKKGQIVAFKGLCEYIIVKKKINQFYHSITKEKIEKIHKNGKLTPLEMVQIWESNDLCAPGTYNSIARCKCDFFNYNCHDCLLEFASHSLEYNVDEVIDTVKRDSVEYKNYIIDDSIIADFEIRDQFAKHVNMYEVDKAFGKFTDEILSKKVLKKEYVLKKTKNNNQNEL